MRPTLYALVMRVIILYHIINNAIHMYVLLLVHKQVPIFYSDVNKMCLSKTHTKFLMSVCYRKDILNHSDYMIKLVDKILASNFCLLLLPFIPCNCY